MSIRISNSTLRLRNNTTGEMQPVSMFGSGADKTMAEIREYAQQTKDNIISEANAAKASIEAKTDEQAARIPEVTELADDVGSLKNDLSEIDEALPKVFINEYVADNGMNHKYIDLYGNEIESELWFITDYMELHHSNFYSISKVGNNPYCGFYDSSKSLISTFKPQEGNLVSLSDIPLNAKYVRFSIYYDNGYSDDANNFVFGYYDRSKIVSEQELEEKLKPNTFNLNECCTGMDNMIWSYQLNLSPLCCYLKRARNNLYWGYTTSEGYSGIACMNCDTHTVKKTHLKKYDVDDHNPVSVYVRDNGAIICAYSDGHNTGTKIHVRVSSARECIDKFDDDCCVDVGYPTSYSQIFEHNNVIYIFFRYGNNSWAYIKSIDYGKTWSNMYPIITASMQYYCKFQETTTDGLLRMCMYSNPSSDDTSIRMGFLDLNTGYVYNSDNSTKLGEVGTAVSHSEFNALITPDTNETQRLFDVDITAPDSISILYCTFTLSSNDDSIYKWYNNGEVVTICNGGESLWHPKYQGGMAFFGNDRIVLARSDNECDKIELWTLSSAPALQKEIYSESKGWLPIRNARPIVDRNHKVVIWHRGYYNPETYTDFVCDAKLYIVSKDKVY